jgi:hypothetical protein
MRRRYEQHISLYSLNEFRFKNSGGHKAADPWSLPWKLKQFLNRIVTYYMQPCSFTAAQSIGDMIGDLVVDDLSHSFT